MNIFDEINLEAEKQENEVVIDLPTDIAEAVQVLTCTTIQGLNGGRGGIHETIVDTFMVDKVNGIIPIEKAKNKAKKLKAIFPDKTYYVVTIYKHIEATY
ncbi:MAG: hypothetical protein Q8O88_03900 [bacterium]|nr:hypothetical protein [bacterium]